MKRLTAVCLMAIMVLALAACGGEKSDTRTIDTFVKAFQESGVEVDAGEKPAFDMIGASDGVIFYIDNKVVKIYEYKDIKALSDTQKQYGELMETWTTNGKFILETSSEKATEIFAGVPSDNK